MTITMADISKANALLGWTPKVGLDEGLDRSIAWYQDNYDWASRVSLP